MKRWLLIGALGISAGLAAETQVFLTLEEAPGLVFPDADTIERKDVPADDTLRALMQAAIGTDKPSVWEPYYISFVAKKSGAIVGFAVICEEIGKHRPFTFIVAVSPSGEVRDVAIMMYREPRGSEVRYPGFVKQFRGKGLSDPIAHRRDIRNVTGATLSSRSLALGVRKALAFLQSAYGFRESAAGGEE